MTAHTTFCSQWLYYIKGRSTNSVLTCAKEYEITSPIQSIKQKSSKGIIHTKGKKQPQWTCSFPCPSPALIQCNSDDIGLMHQSFQHRTKLGIQIRMWKSIRKETQKLRIPKAPDGCMLLFVGQRNLRGKLEPATSFFPSPSLKFLKQIRNGLLRSM